MALLCNPVISNYARLPNKLFVNTKKLFGELEATINPPYILSFVVESTALFWMMQVNVMLLYAPTCAYLTKHNEKFIFNPSAYGE